MTDKNISYVLCIETDGYAGNFERELASWAFGISNAGQEGYAEPYEAAFWKKVSGRGNINSLDQYRKHKASEDKFADLMRRADEILGKEPLSDGGEEDILALYDKYLDYDNGSFYFLPDSSDGTIRVLLKKPLEGNIKDLVMNRIRTFFTCNVQDLFMQYEYLCLYGEPRSTKLAKVNLLSVMLLDKDSNVVEILEGR